MMKNIALLFFVLLQLLSAGLIAQEKAARYVWAHTDEHVRNEYVYFRNDLVLSGPIRKGVIHLFADSRYQIYVNEVFINFGPIRSYPQHPYYDTLDLTPYLRSGQNVIAVKALYNGIENFQVPENRPGFIAWGNIRHNGEIISLQTPGKWVCRLSSGYDCNAVRFSFACAAMEVFDAGREPDRWKGFKVDTSAWTRPVVIPDQHAWGPLLPRSIPLLTHKQITAKHVVSRFQSNNQEDIYSFRIKTADEKRSDYYRAPSVVGYTYIFSPIDQKVEAGLWWGEYYLNGKGPLAGLGEEPARPNRNPRRLQLKTGWNFFNTHYGAIWGAWDFYMALPKSAGLHLSPTKTFDSKNIFMTAGPLPDFRNQKIKKLDRPFSSHREMRSQLDVKWQGHVRGGETNNPALDMVWNFCDNDIFHPPWKTRGIEVTPGNRSSVVFDMGGKTLGRLFIEIKADSGTVIDIGFSEDLIAEKPWLFKRKMISAAVRFVADGVIERFESFKPYGLRYMQVDISGNRRPVLIKKVGVVEQVYPFERVGSFTCSDPMLTAIWKLGWRTLRVCAEDSYIDTPFRERGLYAGDMLPEYAITLAGNGDSRLVKHSLKVFHDKYKPMMYGAASSPHGDFPLINIVTSRWYYDYCGDKAFIEFLYDGYRHLLDRWLASKDENSLVYQGRQFIEWTQIDKEAKLTATHALLSRALQIMSDYADLLNKPADAAYYGEQAEKMRQTVRSAFWDPQRQLFNDGYRQGRLSGSYYPTSNAWPMLYGCTLESQDDAIVDYLRSQFQDIGKESRNRRITPYSSFYALAALYQRNRADMAEQFIRQYWSRMILNGDDTAWENFDIRSENNNGGQGTASHAWSGHPTYFLTTEALGVSLGFHKSFNRNEITISPQSETLSWAKGVVPHPLGPVSVEWRLAGDRLLLNYDAAAGVRVRVCPRGRLAEKTLWVNGKRVDKEF